MTYKIGDIFTNDKEYTARAQWCNENGYFIQEIEQENGVRRFQICAPKEQSLSELKSEKLAELTAITSKFDNQLVNNDMIIKSSLGYVINADIRSQNNIRGLIDVGIEPVDFVMADNSTVSLDTNQLKVLLNDCAINMQHIYMQKWDLKDKIEKATTEDELNSIEIKFTMKDFS
jgi:hypothetical protein